MPAHALVGPVAWTADATVVVALTSVTVLYAVGFTRRRRAGHRGARTVGGVSFAVGMAALALALASPLEAAASTLFTAHMVQHLLLLIVAAPLVVAGRAPAVIAAAIPARWRHRSYRVGATAPVRHVGDVARRPVVAWLCGVVVLWAWHLPALYALAVSHDAVHAVEHATLLAAAMLTWHVVTIRRGRVAVTPAAAILLLFATGMQSGALGALLALARTPLYAVHEAGAAVWGMSPLEDQQLAGMLMWVPPGFVYLISIIVLLFRWLSQLDRVHPAQVAALPATLMERQR